MERTREAKIPFRSQEFSALVVGICAALLILVSALSANAQTDGLEDLEPVPTPRFDALPALQPITRQNVASIEILFTLRCDEGFDTQLLGMGIANNVYDISLSPVDNQIVVVMGEAICIYNLNEPTTEPLIIEVPAPRIFTATFSPDGQSIYAIHHSDDTVRKWETATGSELQTKLDAGDFGNNDTIAFSPDGTLVAAGFDFGIRLWDAESETILVRADTGANRTVMWNRDGTRLIALGRRGLYLYTVYPGPRLFLNETRYAWSGANRVALGGPDDNLLIYYALSPAIPTLLNIDTGEVLDYPNIGSNEYEFSPSDNFLLVGASLGEIDFYDAEQRQIIHQIEYSVSSGGLLEFGLIDFNFDGTLLAVTTYDEVGSVNVWGVRD